MAATVGGDDQTLDRWARWSAIGGVTLFIAFNVLAEVLPMEKVPGIHAPADELTSFFREKYTEVRIAQWLGGLSVVPHLFWLGVLWHRMRAAERGSTLFSVVALSGGILGATVAAVGQAVLGVGIVEFGAGRADVDAMRTFYKLTLFMDAAALMGAAIMVGAVSVTVFRNGFLARWVGWFGAVVTLLLIASSFGFMDDGDPIFTLSLVAIVPGLFVWSGIVTYFMVREPKAVDIPLASHAEVTASA